MQIALNMNVLVLCKFTPLGFETDKEQGDIATRFSVNLPRWGLKRVFEVKELMLFRV